jgi:hypothetical protein
MKGKSRQNSRDAKRGEEGRILHESRVDEDGGLWYYLP